MNLIQKQLVAILKNVALLGGVLLLRAGPALTGVQSPPLHHGRFWYFGKTLGLRLHLDDLRGQRECGPSHLYFGGILPAALCEDSNPERVP